MNWIPLTEKELRLLKNKETYLKYFSQVRDRWETGIFSHIEPEPAPFGTVIVRERVLCLWAWWGVNLERVKDLSDKELKVFLGGLVHPAFIVFLPKYKIHFAERAKKTLIYYKKETDNG